jgi:small conductance mechanosensitive channel
MEATTHHLVDAVQSAIQVASGLAIAYAFSVVGAILILLIGYVIAGLAERSVFAGLGRIRGVDQTLRIFLSKVLRYAILILVGVTVLAQFGVQTASIIATLGAAGLAIGLALQGTLQNIASGIMLLVLRPFRVGEYITVGGISGTVLEIGLFATQLRTWDGLYVMAPNNQLWNTAVTNYSRNPRRLDECAIRITYDDDIGLALRTFVELAKADTRILKEPAPVPYVKELGDTGIMVVLRYWTTSSDNWATKNDLLKTVRETFEQRGISIPFTQRQIQVVGKPAAGAADASASTAGSPPDAGSEKGKRKPPAASRSK